MFTTLPVARYRLRFTVNTSIRLPEYAGSMLRGAFGAALRRTACMTREKNCSACPLFRSCPYPAIFETPAPMEHKLQKFSQVPNPYVIEPPPWGERIYAPGEALEFHMVLLGKALAQLPLIVFAWQRAFDEGVGHGTAELSAFTYCSQKGDIEAMDVSRGRLLPHEQVWHAQDSSSSACLRFETPLRLQHDGHPLPPSQLTARDLLMTLTRRISLLLELHMNQDSLFPFPALAACAEQVRYRHALSWRDWTRFSSRQQQAMQLGGAVGEWKLDGLAPEFGPLLQLGQWLHVGKNATFGLGKYVVLNEG